MRPGAVLVLAVLVTVPAVPAGADAADARALLSLPDGVAVRDVEAAGVRVLEAFPFAGVLLVEGDAASLARRLAPLGVAAYPEEPVSLALAESRALVRADDLPMPLLDLGRGATVAVVDSGVDDAHPAFSGRLLEHVRVSDRGVDEASGDATGHGTHVAGIVAGSGAGSARHRGLAPGGGLVAVDISSSFTTTNAIRAFRWVSENAHDLDIRVVSNSWGREKEDARHDANDPLTRAIDALVDQGLVMVFSAGNRGPGPSTLTQEAMNPRVIAVGAVDDRGALENYSARGPAVDRSGAVIDAPKPDLFAPGSSIVSARAGGGYVVMNGTSMAAPHAAAAAAILVARFPDLGPDDVKRLLQEAARPVAGAPTGLLDVRAAFDAAAEDRRVVSERRVPLAFAGNFVALAGNVLAVADLAAQDAPFQVPAGTREVAFEVAWDGVAPEGVSAALVHEGRRLAEAASKSSPLRIALEEPPEGAWRLVVEPGRAADRVEWRADGALVVTEVHEDNRTVAKPVEKASDPSAFETSGPSVGPPRGWMGRVVTVTAAFALAASIVGVKRKR